MAGSADKIAERIFGILKGFGLQLSIFDAEGNRTVEPAKARRFFAKPGNMLVSLKEDAENSEIDFYLSADTDVDGVKDLIDRLRQTAVHHNVQFTTRRYGKTITPKDFAFVGESVRGDNMEAIKEAHNPMTGSMKSSYQNWNSAKLIIRHNKPVVEDVVGSRSRNIRKIFVETIEGERFLFPVNHLAGARAMARHIGADGAFNDRVGQHIIGLSEEFKDLQKVSRHIFLNRSSLTEDAFDLRETLRNRIDEIRHELGRFMTISGYSQKVEEVQTTEAEPLNEESLQEKVAVLRGILQINEDDDSMTNTLNRVAPYVSEAKPRKVRPGDERNVIAADPAMVDLVKRAYGEGMATDADFEDAAYLLAEPRKIEFLPPNQKSEIKKAGMGPMSPMAKLAWRLGAISERMAPNRPGAEVLSAVLSRIVDKIDEALEKGGQDVQRVNVNPAEKQIVQIFLKQVAPVINESMRRAGHNDWMLVESKKKSTVNGGTSYREARELSEWFENFDPLKIIREAARQEAEEAEGKNEPVEEVHEVEEDDANELNEEEAWWIADRLVRGKASTNDIVTCYESTDRQVIARVLKENWTSETTEAIIKGLDVEDSSKKKTQ